MYENCNCCCYDCRHCCHDECLCLGCCWCWVFALAIAVTAAVAAAVAVTIAADALQPLLLLMHLLLPFIEGIVSAADLLLLSCHSCS